MAVADEAALAALGPVQRRGHPARRGRRAGGGRGGGPVLAAALTTRDRDRDRALVVVPLVGSRQRRDVLVVSRAPGDRGFATGDVSTALTFAGHVSLALEVATRQRDQERIQLLEERARIARDLHDHVIQQLFAAGMTVQGVTASLGDGPQAELLDRVVDLVDDAVGQIRTSIFQLRAQPRDPEGCAPPCWPRLPRCARPSASPRTSGSRARSTPSATPSSPATSRRWSGSRCPTSPGTPTPRW